MLTVTIHRIIFLWWWWFIVVITDTEAWSFNNNNNNNKNVSSKKTTTKPSCMITVCQNKDCCKRFQQQNVGSGSPSSSTTTTVIDLYQTLQLLQPPNNNNNDSNENNSFLFNVESSSCLSHCDLGPNIQLQLPTSDGSTTTEHIIHHVTDVPTLIFELEQIISSPSSSSNDDANKPSSPLFLPLLVAAVKCMNKALQTTSLEQELKLLQSIITKLNSDSILSQSSALYHAYAMRAEYYYRINEYELAKQDARHVIIGSSSSSSSDDGEGHKNKESPIIVTSTTKRIAYRVWSDVEIQQGSYNNAIQILQQWSKIDKFRSTKINNEIQQLLQKQQ